MPLWLVIIYRMGRIVQGFWNLAAPAVEFPTRCSNDQSRRVGRQDRLMLPGHGWMRMVPIAATVGEVRPPGVRRGRHLARRGRNPAIAAPG
jgi:hypothetical protein